jgi:hypothetical protein
MQARSKQLLGFSLAAIGVVWFVLPGKSTTASAPLENTTSSTPIASTSNLPTKTEPGTATLPQQLERDKLEPATRDPFMVVAPPPPAPAKKLPPAPPPPPAPVMAAPAPTAPPLDLRYAGRMTGPDGTLMVFVTYAESPITLSIGQSLPNGYRVDRISDRLVELSYPALGTTARLDLPEPPKYEIR